MATRIFFIFFHRQTLLQVVFGTDVVCAVNVRHNIHSILSVRKTTLQVAPLKNLIAVTSPKTLLNLHVSCK